MEEWGEEAESNRRNQGELELQHAPALAMTKQETEKGVLEEEVESNWTKWGSEWKDAKSGKGGRDDAEQTETTRNRSHP